jgi:putative ABC transport system permease protein
VGLIRYLAAARTREIGIRKVNGADRTRILILLNREFLFLILVALAAGIPGAHYLSAEWLRNYVYRIDIYGWVPFMTATGFLIVSLLTTSIQSWSAASRNPVESLRYE